jgi:hypothetical protein
MDILVGYTGFVGSNIYAGRRFDRAFNSSNIGDAFGTRPDLCVYAGIRAEKFLANDDPTADRAIIDNAADTIRRIAPKRLALISTIDVFKNPAGVDEDTSPNTEGLHAYGANRLALEQQASAMVKDCHILRLPGLFGKNIKKNFIYDLMNAVPSMLNERAYRELAAQSPLIADAYIRQPNRFHAYTGSAEERARLKPEFERVGFSALNFTDSRAEYQFYNLAYLGEHIQLAVLHNIPLLHLATEPLSAATIYRTVKGSEFVNEISAQPPKYDFRTKYADLLGGKNGYVFGKEQVLREIVEFVEGNVK